MRRWAARTGDKRKRLRGGGLGVYSFLYSLPLPFPPWSPGTQLPVQQGLACLAPTLHRWR